MDKKSKAIRVKFLRLEVQNEKIYAVFVDKDGNEYKYVVGLTQR